MAETTIPTPRGELDGYLAVPDAEGPFAGVVVLHEVFGLNADVRRHADRFAGEGYLALAPDLYAWGLTPRCLVATVLAVNRREGRAYDDIQAAADGLVGREDCTGKVGVIGFCMGGGLALAMAPRGVFDVAAPNYGEVPKNAAEVLKGACPVVASFGATDRLTKGRPERLEAALQELGIDHDVKVYADTGHSFLNHHTGFATLLDRMSGGGYRAEPAEDAYSRILAFFDKYLRSSS